MQGMEIEGKIYDQCTLADTPGDSCSHEQAGIARNV